MAAIVEAKERAIARQWAEAPKSSDAGKRLSYSQVKSEYLDWDSSERRSPVRARIGRRSFIGAAIATAMGGLGLLFRQGRRADKMYIIVDGTVVVRVKDGDEDRFIASRSAGDVVGEMGLIESAPRSASVVTEENLHALSLDRRMLERTLRRNPSIAMSMIRVLSDQIREING